MKQIFFKRKRKPFCIISVSHIKDSGNLGDRHNIDKDKNSHEEVLVGLVYLSLYTHMFDFGLCGIEIGPRMHAACMADVRSSEG